MRIPSFDPSRVLAAFLIVSLGACTEPRQVNAVKPAPESPLVARVELSDSSAAPGSLVVVTTRLIGPSVAAATIRLAYDTTGLAYVGEETLDDGAMRAVNPTSGLVRIAAVAPNGIASGRVHALRFMVRRTSALRTMTLSVDEAHSASGLDLAAHVKTP